MPTTLFEPDRSLLNPQFESYRLISEENGELIQGPRDTPLERLERLRLEEKSFALPASPLRSKETFGYKALKDHFNHPHLVVSKSYGQAAYIDENRFVVLLQLNDGLKPTYFPLHKLPTLESELDNIPSLFAFDPNQWLVGDGAGNLTLLHVTERDSRWIARIACQWTLRLPEGGEDRNTPFKIVDCKLDKQSQSFQGQGKQGRLILQRTKQVDRNVGSRPGLGVTGGDSSKTRHSIHTVFEIILGRIDIPEIAQEMVAEGEEGDVKIDAIFTSEEPLLFAHLEHCQEALLASESLVKEEESNSRQMTSVDGPPQEKRAKIGEEWNQVDEKQVRKKQFRTTPPPYAWTQTSETVTLAMMLPPTIRKEDVRCHFSPKGTRLDLAPKAQLGKGEEGSKIVEISKGQNGDEATAVDEVEAMLSMRRAAEQLQSGMYAPKTWWGEIDPDGSVWTWERVVGKGIYQAKEVGLLTLHLEKGHSGTRWTSVFEERKKKPGDDSEEDEEVPETMDASELLNMLEGLEKYTGAEGDVAVRSLGGSIGEGTRAEEPSSLLQDGLEEEDAMVGKPCLLYRVEKRGEGPTFDATLLSETTNTVLATPIPSSTGQPSFVIRRDLDGLVFALPSADEDKAMPHVDTFPALSYVLASKRDAHRIYVFRRGQLSSLTDPSSDFSIVLAFENAPTVEQQARENSGAGTGAGNLFVYYSPRKEKNPAPVLMNKKISNHAESRVIRLGSSSKNQDETSGSLVGVCALDMLVDGREATVLLCLCQRRLLVLTNVLL